MEFVYDPGLGQGFNIPGLKKQTIRIKGVACLAGYKSVSLNAV